MRSFPKRFWAVSYVTKDVLKLFIIRMDNFQMAFELIKNFWIGQFSIRKFDDWMGNIWKFSFLGDEGGDG